jgi:hypothetical protein
MDKMFDYESLFAYMSLIFAIAIFIILLYGCLSSTYNKTIENFTESNTLVQEEPVAAVVKDLEVNETEGITKINLENKGKYFFNTPPKITFTAPDGGTIPEATVELEDAPVAGTNLYEIKEIAIKSDKRGTKYKTTDKARIVIPTNEVYKELANKENPLINLSPTQKTTIIDLIEGCESLSTALKTKYTGLINKATLRQYDVDDIIRELRKNSGTDVEV